MARPGRRFGNPLTPRGWAHLAAYGCAALCAVAFILRLWSQLA